MYGYIHIYTFFLYITLQKGACVSSPHTKSQDNCNLSSYRHNFSSLATLKTTTVEGWLTSVVCFPSSIRGLSHADIASLPPPTFRVSE